MQQFDYTIEHIPGDSNEVADALSRVGHVRRILVSDARTEQIMESQKLLSERVRSKCEQEEGLFIDEADMIPLSSESRDLIQHIISDHHNA
ncbi:DDE-type integrase/transposase/recombinase, partial [Aduncisulcus paluster]